MNHGSFAIAGYAACDVRLSDEIKQMVQGLVDRNLEGYAQKAVQVALDLMDGKPVSEQNVVELRLVHTPPPVLPPSSSERTPGSSQQCAARELPKPFPPTPAPTLSGSEPKQR